MNLRDLRLILAMREAKCRILRERIKESINKGDMESAKTFIKEIFQLSAKPLF